MNLYDERGRFCQNFVSIQNHGIHGITNCVSSTEKCSCTTCNETMAKVEITLEVPPENIRTSTISNGIQSFFNSYFKDSLFNCKKCKSDPHITRYPEIHLILDVEFAFGTVFHERLL